MKSFVLLIVFLCCSISIEADQSMGRGVGGCMYDCMMWMHISEDDCLIECRNDMPYKKRSIEELPSMGTLKNEKENESGKDVKKQG